MKIVAVKENGELKTESPICVNCKYLHMPKPNLIWYEMFCKKHPFEKTINCVTGNIGYVSQNDLGKKVVLDLPYDFCRNHNTEGDCSDYEELS